METNDEKLLQHIWETGERRSFGDEEIANRFGYHKATEFTAPQHQHIRQTFTYVARQIDTFLPEGRAKSVAMAKLEEAAMWSNKAIAEMSPVVEE